MKSIAKNIIKMAALLAVVALLPVAGAFAQTASVSILKPTNGVAAGSANPYYNVMLQDNTWIYSHSLITDNTENPVRGKSNSVVTVQKWGWDHNIITPGANINLEADGVMIGQVVNPVPSGFKLAVEGKVICEELQVQLTADWPDYVFADDYALPSLASVRDYVAKEKHLPGIPSAAEVANNGGIQIGELQRAMLEKVEQLYLHVIELEAKVKAQQQTIDQLQRVK